MTLHETLDSLDRLIQSRSILEHPFYVAWRQGALSRDQLATYARVYYPHVAAFPGYLRAALDVARDPVVRDELERNLADELANPKAHGELWLDFAEDLGLDRTAVAGAEARPAARRIVATFDRLARAESAGALAALYAYESQQPEVASQKADGLRRHYGVERPEALAYFEVHAVTDLEHRSGERRALEHALAGGTASPDVVCEAAGEALDAYWGLLDGVCRDAGLRVMV